MDSTKDADRAGSMVRLHTALTVCLSDVVMFAVSIWTESAMKVSSLLKTATVSGLFGCLALAMTGCQTSVGGQTLPSAYYLRDDVQYFPAGPEFLLSNKVQAIEQYNLDRQGFAGDFGTGDVGGTGGDWSGGGGGPGAPAGFGPAGYDGP